jgi:hypothetical protein
LFPRKCGNWTHLPSDIPEDDPTHNILKLLGFRYGRLCKRHVGRWRHIHPPVGWAYSIEPNGGALFWDQQGNPRVDLWLSSMSPDQKSHIIFRRYHRMRSYWQREDNLGIVVVELRDPYDHVAYTGFQVVPLDILSTHYTAIRTITHISWKVYRMFLRAHPRANDPFAYWATPS